jgi:hypothetical protein
MWSTVLLHPKGCSLFLVRSFIFVRTWTRKGKLAVVNQILPRDFEVHYPKTSFQRSRYQHASRFMELQQEMKERNMHASKY